MTLLLLRQILFSQLKASFLETGFQFFPILQPYSKNLFLFYFFFRIEHAPHYKPLAIGNMSTACL